MSTKENLNNLEISPPTTATRNRLAYNLPVLSPCIWNRFLKSFGPQMSTGSFLSTTKQVQVFLTLRVSLTLVPQVQEAFPGSIQAEVTCPLSESPSLFICNLSLTLTTLLYIKWKILWGQILFCIYFHILPIRDNWQKYIHLC